MTRTIAQPAPSRRRRLPRRGAAAFLAIGLTVGVGCQARSPWVFDETIERQDRLGETSLQMASPVPNDLRAQPDPEDAPPIMPEDQQGPLELSIEQAVFLTIRNNRELSVEQLNPVITGTFEELERAVYDPRVFLEAAYERENLQQNSPGIGGQFDVETEVDYVEGGIAQDLPTGTSFEARLSRDRFSSNLTPTQHSIRPGVSVTQALLQGLDRQANLASIRQARLETDISEYEFRGFTEALVARVEIAYWDYALTQRQVEILEQALEVAQQQLQETQDRIELGALPETELAAANAEVVRRNQDLIDARNRRGQLRIDLLELMNPNSEQQWDREIQPADLPESSPLRLDAPADHVQLALQYRPELDEARLRLEQNRLEVLRTRDGLLPRLDLFATLGKSGYARSFGDAIADIDGPGYDFSAGLRLDYPLGNRAAEARHRAATTSRHQAALSIQNLSQMVEADVRRAYMEVLRAHDQIEASRLTRESQEEVLDAEMAKFEAGTSTALLVAQAQRELLNAELDEARAVVVYRQAVTELYRLEGSLLRRRGVTAPGE